MQIHGFQKTTLLDFPGYVASTIFCGGCDFRCPYCHNGDLVLYPREVPLIPEEEVFAHLTRRREVLDGICITGGEPTLQQDLEAFIVRVKELGLKVKLDTNGYHPEVLMDLCKKNLIDYVAMDIKGAPEQYEEITGVKPWDFNKIQASVYFLMSGEVPYEFRTTVVKELHSIEDMQKISVWISGARAYYLQNYKDSKQVIQRGFHGFEPKELKHMCSVIQEKIPDAQVRGVE